MTKMYGVESTAENSDGTQKLASHLPVTEHYIFLRDQAFQTNWPARMYLIRGYSYFRT